MLRGCLVFLRIALIQKTRAGKLIFAPSFESKSKTYAKRYTLSKCHLPSEGLVNKKILKLTNPSAVLRRVVIIRATTPRSTHMKTDRRLSRHRASSGEGPRMLPANKNDQSIKINQTYSISRVHRRFWRLARGLLCMTTCGLCSSANRLLIDLIDWNEPAHCHNSAICTEDAIDLNAYGLSTADLQM